jgi:hypothetical protein
MSVLPLLESPEVGIAQTAAVIVAKQAKHQDWVAAAAAYFSAN